MSDASALKRHAVVNEVFMTVCCLFVVDARLSEMQMSYRLADYADPQRLGDVTGKYVKRATGYVHIGENGNARALDELPEGLSSNDVVVDELAASHATPLQDRLRTIAHSLRVMRQDADTKALTDGIDASLEACRPEKREQSWEQIKEWGRSEVFDASGPGNARDMTERAHRFLDHLPSVSRLARLILRGSQDLNLQLSIGE